MLIFFFIQDLDKEHTEHVHTNVNAAQTPDNNSNNCNTEPSTRSQANIDAALPVDGDSIASQDYVSSDEVEMDQQESASSPTSSQLVSNIMHSIQHHLCS